MWKFLATSRDPITDDGNLANKAYFCLVLFDKLADLLRPVDSRLMGLGNMIRFLPHKMAYPWERYIMFEQNLMCFQLPRKLYI